MVVLNGESLIVCDKIKTFGIVLGSKLTFSDHVTLRHTKLQET